MVEKNQTNHRTKKHLQVLSCPNQGDIGQCANCLSVGHVIRKCRHTVDNPVNNGINYLSTGAEFLASTVSYIHILDLFQIAWTKIQKIFSQNGGFMVMNPMVNTHQTNKSKRGGDIRYTRTNQLSILGNNKNNLELQATSFKF